jgi:hypothetical protein
MGLAAQEGAAEGKTEGETEEGVPCFGAACDGDADRNMVTGYISVRLAEDPSSPPPPPTPPRARQRPSRLVGYCERLGLTRPFVIRHLSFVFRWASRAGVGRALLRHAQRQRRRTL